MIDLDLVSAASMALGDRAVAAGVWSPALYQLSPAKAACLDSAARRSIS